MDKTDSEQLFDHLNFGAITIKQFLAEYWQQKPLFVKNAFNSFTTAVSADELAGLACEPHVESRIVQGGSRDQQWSVQHGPFEENDFNRLPTTHWTLLVQAVDHWVPQLGELLDQFNFIPNWRIDDIMLSYASDEGSVGPHFDYYDVFLIQAQGQKEWRIGQHCDDNSPLYDNYPLKILREFQQTDSWILSAGDMLYIPPGYAHWGIARGSSMTYSIGFRSISTADILHHYCAQYAEHVSEAHRYCDPGLALQSNPGEISDVAIDQLYNMLTTVLSDKTSFTHWVGRYATEPKYSELATDANEVEQDWKSVLQALQHNNYLYRNETSRLAYTHVPKGNGVDIDFYLYVDGHAIRCSDSQSILATQLCRQRCMTSKSILSLTQDTKAQALLVKLIQREVLYFG